MHRVAEVDLVEAMAAMGVVAVEEEVEDTMEVAEVVEVMAVVEVVEAMAVVEVEEDMAATVEEVDDSSFASSACVN